MFVNYVEFIINISLLRIDRKNNCIIIILNFSFNLLLKNKSIKDVSDLVNVINEFFCKMFYRFFIVWVCLYVWFNYIGYLFLFVGFY